eukprot:6961394-Prymnesium_polylepis.1
MGLHAGTRRRFKAEVVGLRKQFPRIIVNYIATEDGNTAAIALPEMRTAYVTMADVEPKDWTRARNGADGRIQDTTQHLHDRACTHESSNVQGVQEGGGQGGASHRDSR